MPMRVLRWPLAALLSFGVVATAAIAEAKPIKFYPGDDVVLVMQDSTHVTGKFVDLGRVSVEAYRDRYDAWRHSSIDGALLPELGERVELGTGRITTSGRVTFVGLGHEGVEVRRGDGATRTVSFDRFSKMVLADGRRLESDWIREQCESGSAPLATTIEVAVADGNTIVPFDDVRGVESRSGTGWPVTQRASFNSESSVQNWVTSIQAGGLWADDSEYGLVAHGFSWRVSPSFATPRIGVDAQIGFLQAAGSGGGFDAQVALCGAVPVGSRIGIAPRLGVGILVGADLGVPITTLGAGVLLRLDRNVGFRADYTFEHLIGTGYNYEGISMLQFGMYWGR